ncbi:MAG: sodium:alanine symporter family protein [Gammaproteobacteria bacterium]|nr:sodium:alanine symporter family protein [Gammaproteobacteria bacterium]MCP5423633.1 sodium:alanine symporter family protein [Gammaproteobacteria bacterium]MCP5459886.1 sodium:alanine symporter family protein [Gammaproteobacteria bacterium]
MENFLDIVNTIDGFVWGPPLLILLVGTGLYLTIILRGLQFRRLVYSLWLALIKRHEKTDQPGDISHFQALMTALSATVGTGNIAGVATAIAVGGPGALFWMWVTGLVGMATKYSEAVLAVKYRVKDANGNMSGGPMYYIERGLGWRWMGLVFAFFTAIAAFGIGNMVQSNSVADALQSSFSIPHAVTGVVLVIATAAVVLGGITSIGRVTGVLVPVMILFYIAGSLIILVKYAGAIPGAFALIFHEAFTPTAATGGFAGATLMLSIRMGVARGVFSNESGLGSSPIAAAAAKTKHPVSQALVSMTQTFIDTLVVCTMTGLVLVVTGAWSNGDNGASLTATAYGQGVAGGHYIVTIGLLLFAYSTILGWCYYGERATEYLLGEWAVKPYRILFSLAVGVGAILKLDLVWALADLFNGLMAVPNLIALLMLSPVIVSVTRDYFDRLALGEDPSVPEPVQQEK